MNREAFTQKLVRILEDVDAGGLPAKVLELYVFGSYAAGAAEPHDLDLMVVYEAPDREWIVENAKTWREAGMSELDAGLRAHRKHQTRLGYALRHPREMVQVALMPVLLERGRRIRMFDVPDDAVLLWSAADRLWRPKLESLLAGPPALPPRITTFAADRFKDVPATIRKVVTLLERGELVLARRAVGFITMKLSPENQRLLQDWTDRRRLGKRMAEAMPYALHWLQGMRQQPGVRVKSVLWSRAKTHCVQIGRAHV